MHEKIPILILAGFSCAGKSTITSLLSTQYCFELVDQRNIYHKLAVSKGYRRTRHWLADVGNETFVSETTKETIRRIREIKITRGVIIDTTYGEMMVSMLKKAFPGESLIIISVIADRKTRINRMMRRLNSSRTEAIKELKFRDDFLTEVGVEGIMSLAEIEISNTKNIQDTIEYLSDKLKAYNLPAPESFGK